MSVPTTTDPDTAVDSPFLTPASFEPLLSDIIGGDVEVVTRFRPVVAGQVGYDPVRGYYVRTETGRRVWHRSWTAVRFVQFR